MSNEPVQRSTAVKSTETVKKVRAFVKKIYTRAHEAKQNGQPVAYCMTVCQYDEILPAMGIVPIWTENYAGLCSAKRAGDPFILKAESDGFSNLICGYARTGLGYDALRQQMGVEIPGAPDGGMAKPDMMLGCSYACDPRYKWYQAIEGRYLDVPIYSHDVVIPPIDANLKDVLPYYVKYQTEQLAKLVDFLERTTNRKMDYDRLAETLDISDRTYKLWWDSYQIRRKSPCPMGSQDHFNAFVPAFFFSGEMETLQFYQDLYNELEEKAKASKGVIQDEKYRLMWAMGLPPWHNMRIFNYWESKGAVSVIEALMCYRPWEPVEVPKGLHPLEHVAWRSLLRNTDRFEKAARGVGHPGVQLILDLIEDYNIDGLVMHATKSCRATTVGQIYLKNLIQEHVDLPALVLESDMVDARDFSETQTFMKIDAFIEAVDSGKKARQGKAALGKH